MNIVDILLLVIIVITQLNNGVRTVIDTVQLIIQNMINIDTSNQHFFYKMKLTYDIESRHMLIELYFELCRNTITSCNCVCQLRPSDLLLICDKPTSPTTTSPTSPTHMVHLHYGLRNENDALFVEIYYSQFSRSK